MPKLFWIVLGAGLTIIGAVMLDARPAVAFAGKTFAVNDKTDRIDDNLTDGICHTAAGTCTLRAAVMQANALGGTNTINLPAGTFTITLSGNDTQARAGDLDLRANMTIHGSGRTETVIDGNAWGRVFHVFSPAQVTLIGLTVRNGRDLGGGGILNEGTLNLTNVLLRNNADTGAAGGGLANTGAAHLVRSRVIDNSTMNTGGGIANTGSLSLSETIVQGNTAVYGGGVISAVGSTLVIESSTFTGNHGGVGGAMDVGGTTAITNSTISGNTASAGGGILAGGASQMSLLNVTIADNGTGSNPATVGRGLYLENDHQSMSIKIKNSLLANSGQGGNCSFDPGLSLVSLGHNLVTDSSCKLAGTGDLVKPNALLGPLQLNAPGLTPTQALLANSPAIDHADNKGCPAVDQRGKSRPVGAACDIGAFERRAGD